MKKNLGAKPLLFPTPVLVVATYDNNKNPNAMTAAWGGICCSAPPCVAVSLRKATYSYANLLESKCFTLNIPSIEHVKQSDYLGMASGKEENKFKTTGLTPVKSDFVNAPYIEEFAVNLECKIINTMDLGLHTQFIGEILNIKINSNLVENGNQSVIEEMRPFVYSPYQQKYYAVGDEIGNAFSIGKGI